MQGNGWKWWTRAVGVGAKEQLPIRRGEGPGGHERAWIRGNVGTVWAQGKEEGPGGNERAWMHGHVRTVRAQGQG